MFHVSIYYRFAPKMKTKKTLIPGYKNIAIEIVHQRQRLLIFKRRDAQGSTTDKALISGYQRTAISY